MSRFVDRVVLHLQAGNGGYDCSSVLREKFKPLGGLDGGNGGHDGDIVFMVDPQIHTLMDFHSHPHIRAANGKPGAGDHRNGARGEDLVLGMPEGTVVMAEDGEVLADMTSKGVRFIAAEGGYGGLGNAALVNKNHRVPGSVLLGEPSEVKDLVLELKSMADVGLVGFPSAGKSLLVSTLSVAKPKIGDYPFTTLQPNLSVVNVGYGSFTIADVPGLIPGASEGCGFGLDFLRHAERCAMLVHVVDAAALEGDRDPASDIQALEAELANYQSVLKAGVGLRDLVERPRVIVPNKIDLLDAREMIDIQREELEKFGWLIYEISMATHGGFKELTYGLKDQIVAYRKVYPLPTGQEPRVVVRPEGVCGKKREGAEDFIIERDLNTPDGFIVRDCKPERRINQTDLENDEAVGYLADRLVKLGVGDALAKAGAKVGHPVTISHLTFEWYPQRVTGTDDFVPSGRGTDDRLYANERTSAEQRKRASQARRGLIGEYDFGDGEEAIRDRYSQALAPALSASEDFKLAFCH